MKRETINQILDLRFANKTYEEIAATVGYTPRTVGRVLGKHRADLALMHSQWLELNNETPKRSPKPVHPSRHHPASTSRGTEHPQILRYSNR
jgi:hypothetical protein